MTQENEMKLGFLSLDLGQIKKDAENISSQWNGDEAGEAEDKAHCAEEVIETINKLQELLNELYK